MSKNKNNAMNGVQKQKPLWWHSLRMPNISVGSTVKGKITEKTGRSLYVDLNDLGSGVIWGQEFISSQDTINSLEIGDEITTKVINIDSEKGMIDLSLKEASRELGWKWLKDAQQKDDIISGKIVSANSGGLIVQINDFQGFLPTSQMSEEYFPKVEGGNKEEIIKKLNGLVGKEMKIQVLEVNVRENKIILSEKKIKEDKIKEELEKKYDIGDIISGVAVKINDFGANLEIGEEKTKGFIPIAEIDWKPVENIENEIKIGEEYKVKILGIRGDGLKLSIKMLKEDPWIEKAKNYKEGQNISGEVHKFIQFGALIKVEENIFGFIHSSEFAGKEKMEEALEIGKNHDFVIVSIKEGEKIINLKLEK